MRCASTPRATIRALSPQLRAAERPREWPVHARSRRAEAA